MPEQSQPPTLLESPLHRLLRDLRHSGRARRELHVWSAASLQALRLIDADRRPTELGEAVISAFYLHDCYHAGDRERYTAARSVGEQQQRTG